MIRNELPSVTIGYKSFGYNLYLKCGNGICRDSFRTSAMKLYEKLGLVRYMIGMETVVLLSDKKVDRHKSDTIN